LSQSKASTSSTSDSHWVTLRDGRRILIEGKGEWVSKRSKAMKRFKYTLFGRRKNNENEKASTAN